MRDTSPLTLSPLVLPKASEEAARQIALAIRNGQVRTGDKLPSERILAQQLEVSRVTVREALRLLAEAGFLDIRAGAGGGSFIASEMVPPEFIYPSLSITPQEMIDVLDARRLVMPHIAEVATMNLTEADIEAMEQAIDFARQRISGAPTEVVTEDMRHVLSVASMRFDLAMAAATRNGLLIRMMTMLLTWLDSLRILTLRSPDDMARALGYLDDTLTALKAGDRKALAETLDRRMTQIEGEWERASGRRLRRDRPAFLGGPDA
ncbi:FadR/GntR family transcriptional regulator [Pseudooceanicola sp. HF7]|uniref:FadR/GntR family transcriptional regulator n=1 Tax=Pseudooceanicola sp. HF7 TaxID=2721560 RepID=UPI0014315554|nr:GntR family transcriptional regulator [Pseudooceanicola sp. HF7]NIZ10596.1 FadR family transcriptional regulator [Pseudooceanicola sp. HF7]